MLSVEISTKVISLFFQELFECTWSLFAHRLKRNNKIKYIHSLWEFLKKIKPRNHEFQRCLSLCKHFLSPQTEHVMTTNIFLNCAVWYSNKNIEKNILISIYLLQRKKKLLLPFYNGHQRLIALLPRHIAKLFDKYDIDVIYDTWQRSKIHMAMLKSYLLYIYGMSKKGKWRIKNIQNVNISYIWRMTYNFIAYVIGIRWLLH